MKTPGSHLQDEAAARLTAVQETGLTVRRLQDDALRSALPALAQLRIRVFSEYPYLYDGDLDYESRYIERFAAAAGALIVAVFDGPRLVGAATAAPLATQLAEIVEPWHAGDLPIEQVCYLGESVLLAEYRGRGVGHLFFDLREQHARGLPEMRWTSFCAVERAANDPRRPADHRPLDGFWSRRGYRPLAGVRASLDWREIGDRDETPHSLRLWLRALR
ncbi:MAG: GNAT family N-acetyltransferase [Gammaproteobacteria bacterium]|nr:GNAT family N-acetyltransferase [Gammaproteobacteria bacterium]